MEISSNVVTTQEEVQVVTLVEKKALHLSIKVDQQFLDLLNGLGKTSPIALRQMGLTLNQQEAVHQFYAKTSIIFRGTPKYIKDGEVGATAGRWTIVE